MNIPLYARNFERNDKTMIEVWYNKQCTVCPIPFKPYFYSRVPRYISNARCSMERLKFISDLHDEIVYKYEFDSVKDIPLYRDENSLEFDIPYLQRVAIDDESFYTQFNQTNDLDMLYFDIETDTTGLFPKPKRNIIIAISYAFNNNDVVTYSVDNIKQGDANILELFMNDLKKLDPDVLVGYNMLGFDLPYIVERLRINGLSDALLTRNKGDASFVDRFNRIIMNIQGRVLFDVFSEVLKDQTLYGISNRGMKEVAKWFNIEKKIQSDDRYREYKIILEYLGDMRSLIGTTRLKNYVESDVLITRGLSDFYFKNIITFAEMLKLPISVLTKRTANLIGTIVYARELRKKKVISDKSNYQRYPTIFGVPTYDSVKGKYLFSGGTGMQGALVGLYKDGKVIDSELKMFYENIWKIDFAGMYPSIQRTFKLSPETCKIVNISSSGPSNLTFQNCGNYLLLGIPDKKMGFVQIKIDNEEEGFLPKMLAQMHDERQKIKKQLKDSRIPSHMKSALESLSWTIKVQQNMNYGINGSGYFRYGDVAVTIATTGLGRHFMQFVLDLAPQKNISCDTDGVYLKGKPDIEFYNNSLNRYVTEQFGLKSYMELEMEGPFPKGYFLKRKNYLLLRPDGIIVKHGNSFKGTSKNILFSYALERLSAAMFDASNDIKQVIVDCFKLDKRGIKDFVQRTHINRPVVDYASHKCLQVQVAEQVQRYHDIGIEPGDSVEYVKHVTGYTIKDLAKLDSIDRKYYALQIQGVLNRLGLSHNIRFDTSKLKLKSSKVVHTGYIYDGNGVVSKQSLLQDF